jgi:hypothetical protein
MGLLLVVSCTKVVRVAANSFCSVCRCVGRNFSGLWAFPRSDHLKPQSTTVFVAAVGNIYGLVLASC